jgi:hypothetical protein
VKTNNKRERFAAALDSLLDQFCGEMPDRDFVEVLAERIWQIGHESGIEHGLELSEDNEHALPEIESHVAGGNA